MHAAHTLCKQILNISEHILYIVFLIYVLWVSMWKMYIIHSLPESGSNLIIILAPHKSGRVKKPLKQIAKLNDFLILNIS